MSEVSCGVVVRCAEPQAREAFAALHSRLPLKMVRLGPDVFGVYAPHRTDAFDKLEKIAAQLSRGVGAALFFWYDSRVCSIYRLYEHGEPTRELQSDDEKSQKKWGKGDPLEALGVRLPLEHDMLEAFLYDHLEPFADNFSR